MNPVSPTRRSSVIGPMLLILLGLAFLIHNVLPDIPVADMVAQYWPFLLIGWGFLRLIEILHWASAGKPLPRSGISGGEWMTVIVLCMLGGITYTARHHVNWLPNARSFRNVVINMGESFDYNASPVSRETTKAPRVVIENFRGNARIVGTDESKVTASGHKTIRAFQQNEADQADKSTQLELVNQGDQIIVRTNQDHVNDNLRVTSDLEITVPKGATVEAHGRNGDFDIHDLTGGLEINSDNAGVRVDNIGGDVRIEVRKSDIVRASGVKGAVELKGRGQDVEFTNIDGKVTVNGDFLGQVQFKNLAQPVRWDGAHTNLEFEKLPGQLHMGAGELTAMNLVGPIRLVSRNRDVTITDFTQALDVSLDRGDIELRPGKGALPKMDVKTKTGDIDVALPPTGKFELRMLTSRGEAHNEFGEPLKMEEEHRGARLLGDIGAGPRLNLETGRGTVTARKAGEPDLKAEDQ